MPAGVNVHGPVRPAAEVTFRQDITYLDGSGTRRSDQTIFDTVFDLIARAQTLVLADMFLFNDWGDRDTAPHRRLSAELTDALVRKKTESPQCRVVLITDPINTLYEGVRAPQLERLRAAGVTVVMTDLNRLRDSTPVYSTWWRILIRPFGNSTGGVLPNPFGSSGLSLRTYLRMLNLKANHRKALVADPDGVLTGLVTSANPHDASSAHGNVALCFTGPAVHDLLEAELAVAALSRCPLDLSVPVSPPPVDSPVTVQVTTERAIKDAVLDMLRRADAGDEVDLVMFYISDRLVLRELRQALYRGAALRVVLDPNKDAFGMEKSGVPNRPVGRELQQAGVPVRWYDTHGEQCHTKMLLVRYASGRAELILGSANFTGRNLNNLNLEADVVVRGPAETEALAAAKRYVDDIWENRHGRTCTVEYEAYRDPSPIRHWQYLLMEWSGISTF
ncbi:MAG: phospholipase [Lentisphaeria bacterium]|nr:phospholipase [Lentisphaeria bacterium]